MTRYMHMALSWLPLSHVHVDPGTCHNVNSLLPVLSSSANKQFVEARDGKQFQTERVYCSAFEEIC